jgi:hypothetical protein
MCSGAPRPIGKPLFNSQLWYDKTHKDKGAVMRGFGLAGEVSKFFSQSGSEGLI